MSTDESRVVKSGGLNDENQGSNIVTSRAVKSMVEGLPRSRQNRFVEGRGSKIKSCTASRWLRKRKIKCMGTEYEDK